MGLEFLLKDFSPPSALILFAITMLLATILLLVSADIVSPRPQHLARRGSSVNIPSDPDSWKRFVRGPSEHIIQPISVNVLPTVGHVINLQGLVDRSAPTVLMRMNITDEVPSVIVDFGLNTVGILSIEFDAGEGVEGDEWTARTEASVF